MINDHQIKCILKKFFPNDTFIKLWDLEGGVSHIVNAIELKTAENELRKLVIKSYKGFQWKNQGDNIADKEFQTLRFLKEKGFKVPKVYFLDTTKSILPNSYILMELVEGNSQLNLNNYPKSTKEMAHFLSAVHNLNIENLSHLEIPNLESPIEGSLEYLPQVNGINNLDKVINKLSSFNLEKINRPVLTHGDFWQNNILWKEEKITAVIDWEDVSIGDPMADFASSRIELFCIYEKDVTGLFSSQYLNGYNHNTHNLSVWEIYSASSAIVTMDSWGLKEEEKRKRMDRTTLFLMNTIDKFLEER